MITIRKKYFVACMAVLSRKNFVKIKRNFRKPVDDKNEKNWEKTGK